MSNSVVFNSSIPGDSSSMIRSAFGNSFIIHEWSGSGPPYTHVHFEDDEAWHVLEGELDFSLDRESVKAAKGTTVFVPAGVPHTYTASENARYLIILTPRLNQLIIELQSSPLSQHQDIMSKFKSAIV